MGGTKVRQKDMAMTSYQKYDLLIETGEILNFSGDNLKIFDCRADLSDADLGYKKFLESHISKSQYFLSTLNWVVCIALNGILSLSLIHI